VLGVSPLSLLLLLLASLLHVAAPARADSIPPDVFGCTDKAVGARCDDPSGGTCQRSTCVKIDYAHWNPDASSTRPTVTYDCLRCACHHAGDAEVSYEYGATCKRHDGCAVRVGQGPRQLLALGLATAVGALLWRRQRRRR
jgi:MYXO-CTERM domain-containing protein